MAKLLVFFLRKFSELMTQYLPDACPDKSKISVFGMVALYGAFLRALQLRKAVGNYIILLETYVRYFS